MVVADGNVHVNATSVRPDVIVLYEHPEWQKPLFAALERRGVSFVPLDVTRAAFSNAEPIRALLYFNQASPSAYVRGHTRAPSPAAGARGSVNSCACSPIS